MLSGIRFFTLSSDKKRSSNFLSSDPDLIDSNSNVKAMIIVIPVLSLFRSPIITSY
jgi:hypothetical protein